MEFKGITDISECVVPFSCFGFLIFSVRKQMILLLHLHMLFEVAKMMIFGFLNFNDLSDGDTDEMNEN